MDYNSQRKQLVLPEYGRHIHKMVEYATTIEDRDERLKCAYSIISVMGNLFPHLRDVSDFKHKLWDHLALMSDFKLDIDYPYDVTKINQFSTTPDKVPYSDYVMTYRHYGRLVEQMIKKASGMGEGELKDHLVTLIVGQMKKSLINWNKDNATDERVMEDIKRLSGGALTAESRHFRGSGEPRENQNVRNNINRKKQHFQRNKGRE